MGLTWAGSPHFLKTPPRQCVEKATSEPTLGAVPSSVAVSPAGVIAAATGVATLGLVGVTAWYVVLTKGLVEAQRQVLEQSREAEAGRTKAERRNLHRQALVEIWQVCNANFVSWDGFRRELGRLDSDGTAFAEAVAIVKDLSSEEADRLAEMTNRLVAATPNVPHDVHSLTWEVGARLMRVANVFNALRTAVAEVSLEASTTGSEPSLKDVATKWTLEYRPEAEGLEWDDLVGGKFLDLPAQRLHELESKAYKLARQEFDVSWDA